MRKLVLVLLLLIGCSFSQGCSQVPNRANPSLEFIAAKSIFDQTHIENRRSRERILHDLKISLQNIPDKKIIGVYGSFVSLYDKWQYDGRHMTDYDRRQVNFLSEVICREMNKNFGLEFPTGTFKEVLRLVLDRYYSMHIYDLEEFQIGK